MLTLCCVNIKFLCCVLVANERWRCTELHLQRYPRPELRYAGVDAGHVVARHQSPAGQTGLVPDAVFETGHRPTAVTLKYRQHPSLCQFDINYIFHNLRIILQYVYAFSVAVF